MTIDRFARKALQLQEELFQVDALALFLFHTGEDSWCRFEIDNAGEAIDDSGLPIVGGIDIRPGRNDRRDAERTGKDRGM